LFKIEKKEDITAQMNFSGLVSLLATVVSRLTAHDHSGCQLTRN